MLCWQQLFMQCTIACNLQHMIFYSLEGVPAPSRRKGKTGRGAKSLTHQGYRSLLPPSLPVPFSEDFTFSGFYFYLFIYFHIAISYLGHSSKRGHLLRFDCSNYFLNWGGEFFNKRCQKDASITRTMIFWNTLLKYSVYSRLCSSKFCIFQALMGLKFGLEAGRKQQRRSQEEELKTLRILIPPRSYVNKNTCKLYSWTAFS